VQEPFRTGRPPVMMDVARLAGVSHQTVSRVLNDHPSVRDETRRRVEEAIGQLDYRRNTVARALATHRTHTLGLVSVDAAQYGPEHAIFGLEEAARAAGYFVNFASLREVTSSAMREALNHLVNASVDGIVVIAPVRSVVEAVHRQRPDIPLVMVEAGHHPEASGVVVDQAAGARLATRHLLDLGHRTVMHVRGPQDWVEAEARERGWLAELSRAQRPIIDSLAGDWSPRSGYDAGQLIARRQDVTAVFAANDQMSLGIMRALHEAGRTVPDDVSIVGFDDIAEAGYFHVPLTTVRQDFAEVGKRCIERLLALINGREVPVQTAIRPELIVRASTGPPPGHPVGPRTPGRTGSPQRREDL
jgi:DNA-binding LacI/PurR family transcriptional regulator